MRKNNIEFRKIKNGSHKNYKYELLKWWPNKYYGNREKMVKEEGYRNFDGGITKNNHTITDSCFVNPETCCVVAWVKKDNEGHYLETVGSRLIELNEEERKNFFELYDKLNKKLEKKKSE